MCEHHEHEPLFPELLGHFVAKGTHATLGSCTVRRHAEPALDGRFVRIRTQWQFDDRPPSASYSEESLIGLDTDRDVVACWQFDSMGGHSIGRAESNEANGPLTLMAETSKAMQRQHLSFSRDGRHELTIEEAPICAAGGPWKRVISLQFTPVA